jgi:glutaredoxin 3
MFTLYTKDNCPNCDKAKTLLMQNGIGFRTLKLGEDFSREELLAKIPTARMMPQIMKDDQVIGSLTELKQLLAA